MSLKNIEEVLKQYQGKFFPVVPFDASRDELLLMDFTANNKELNDDILNNTEKFSKYINQKLKKNNATYGVGGYNEHRTIYSRSNVFDSTDNEEPRRLHLGIDIWGKEGTEISAPLIGLVHSFAFNNAYGDYGATIILQHELAGVPFYTLYGHLSLSDIKNLHEGEQIDAGKVFAHFGSKEENGNWPPHLHFQLITNIENRKGDYPGVCKFSERNVFLKNCPDPDLILNMMQYAKDE